MSEQDDKSALEPGEQGADEMGGATGITGGDESARPGEGVQSKDRSEGGEATGGTGAPGGPAATGSAAGGGRAEGGSPQAPDDAD
jgi:hypothetical protein